MTLALATVFFFPNYQMLLGKEPGVGELFLAYATIIFGSLIISYIIIKTVIPTNEDV